MLVRLLHIVQDPSGEITSESATRIFHKNLRFTCWESMRVLESHPEHVFFFFFFSSSTAVFFIAKPSMIVVFVVQTKWTFNHEGRGHRSLIGVSRGIGRPHRDTLGFSEYKILYARCWDQFVLFQIVCDLPHRAEGDPNTSLPTVRLPTWLDKWFLASPDARSRTPCPLPRRPSPKRTPSSSWKRLEILNVQPRFAVSPFPRSNNFLL